MNAKDLGLGLAGLVAVALLAGLASPAQAYGPEGMFGGRPRPDDVIVLDNPVLPEDRPQRAQSVLQHPRPDFDPVPITLGGFEFFPSAEMGAYYDSNIYAQPDDTTSDVIIGLRPAVSAFSNWSRHAVSTTVFGDLNFYTDKEDENYADFVSSVEGRYDIMPQTWVASRFGYQHLAEPRSSPDAVNGINPTTFNAANGGLTAYRGVGKVKAAGNYDLRRYFYNNTPTATGEIDQSFRDRTEQKLGPRVSYELTENLKPFVEGNYNWRTYDNFHAHQSNGYDAVVGATADFGGITSAEAYVGWMS
ncbi:MAG: outer membrane beta-barrel protein, partial [Alphaproteobacteria bacterium]|nr:outer membrane beta-barrel protein [Alphaproteobacteria bacterium]